MRLITLFLIFLIPIVVFSQESKKYAAYNPLENAEVALQKVIEEAKAQKKYVFVQIGGNWCVWCAKFDQFATTNHSVDSLFKANFVKYHLNYSKENKNLQILEKYRFPQRFGFPVFLILDTDGNLIHTQNSAYLEENKGYGLEKVIEFLTAWAPDAFDPSKYK